MVSLQKMCAKYADQNETLTYEHVTMFGVIKSITFKRADWYFHVYAFKWKDMIHTRSVPDSIQNILTECFYGTPTKNVLSQIRDLLKYDTGIASGKLFDNHYVITFPIDMFELMDEDCAEFALLHEIGHIELRHYEDGELDPADFKNGLLDNKECEIAADRFAFEHTHKRWNFRHLIECMTRVIMYNMSNEKIVERTNNWIKQLKENNPDRMQFCDF